MSGSRLSRLFLLGVGSVFLLLFAYKVLELGTDISGRTMLLHFGVPLILALVFGAGALFPPTPRAHICVWITAFAVGCLAAEIYLTATALPERGRRHRDLVDNWQARNIDYDPRTWQEVVEELRRSGKAAYPKLNPGTVIRPDAGGKSQSSIRLDGHELVPAGTVSNTLSVYCNETGQYLIYRSDEYGFHNPKGIWKTGQ